MSPPSSVKTPPTTSKLSSQDELGMKLAIKEAQEGLEQGGVPIGACLIQNSTQKVLGTGRNLRCQEDSPILHGETSCLRNIGRLPAKVYKDCTYATGLFTYASYGSLTSLPARMYTTLSPCTMCTGSVLLFGIPRVVIGENDTFVGGEDWLVAKGVEVVNVDSAQCKDLMRQFIEKYPEVWNEDIGEE